MSDESKTIRVHQYAECSAGEADKHPHIADARTGLFCDNTILFVTSFDLRIPVRYLGVVERPAPPKPRERVVYRFEEVAEPVQSDDGRWWYYCTWAKEIASYSTAQPPRHNIAPLRRTVERIAVEPERWAGCAKVDGSRMSCRGVAQVGFLGIFAGENRPTREQAEADLPILRNLAEQYAAAHGATIEWRDRND